MDKIRKVTIRKSDKDYYIVIDLKHKYRIFGDYTRIPKDETVTEK